MPGVKKEKAQTPRIRGFASIEEVPGFKYGSTVFKTAIEAEQARSYEFACALVEEFTYQGEFAFEDLIEHLQQYPADRDAFVKVFEKPWEPPAP